MSDKYFAEKSQWSKAMTQDTEICLDNNELIKADKTLSMAYTAIQNDKYSDLSYKRRDNKQNELTEYNKVLSRLRDYSMKIFSVVDGNEAAYAKRISKQYEEISLIDIRSFASGKIQVSTTSYYKSTTDEMFNTRTSNANLYALFANSEILRLEGDFNNNFSEETMKAYLNEYIDSKFEHEVLIDKELRKIYNTVDLLPFIGTTMNLVEGIRGKSFTGEKYTEEEQTDKVFLSTWSLLDDFTGVKTGGFLGKSVGKGIKSKTMKSVSNTKYGNKRIDSAIKKVQKYKKKIPKETKPGFDYINDIGKNYFESYGLKKYNDFTKKKY